ncbi:MAG: FIST C-terminal domain-containing protein [Oscillospiraceae bacterium]|nr:FIST C-terminal domain-containing protein [Oscillospiraceae bacterium]
MIKAQTAFTAELDDPRTAVEEILSQLDLGALPKNNVGIISFYQDALETGVLEAVSKALPFDTVGCTVLAGGTQKELAFEQVSVTVLSSDDVKFSAAVSGEITYENAEEATRACYRDAFSRLGGETSLALVFGPVTRDISGDRYTLALSEESGGAPVFGTLSNTGIVYEDALVAYNGKAANRLLSLILVSGDIEFKFYTRAISDSNVTRRGAIVTESDGYLLKKINGVSVRDYLLSIGISTGEEGAIASLPILVDYKDGTKPAAYSMYGNTDKGMLVGGAVPVGAEIALADVDYGSVMSTAEDALDILAADLDKDGASVAFVIPCFSRCLTLGTQSNDEMDKTAERLGDRVPYMYMYSGGEICPVRSSSDGRLVNRFHNMTYTAMTLR